jgi:ubiquinone/menaquinone biosynthesis C-methylase UbiE
MNQYQKPKAPKESINRKVKNETKQSTLFNKPRHSKNLNSPQQKSTSWEGANQWYKKIVGDQGHYYHQQVIMPKLLKLFNFKPGERINLLDLACGNGVLARHLPKNASYTGIDISPSFIKEAKKLDPTGSHRYHVCDVTQKLPTEDTSFNYAAIILALQNIRHPLKVFQNFAKHLEKGATLILVLNHPCFRIPRQSSWEIDQAKKIQFRRVDRYLSPLEIPLLANPSKGLQSEELLSYHYPLSSYIQWLGKSGFCVVDMEEWCSDKTSEGGAAKMENRARQEFPLFMTICAKKI